MTAPYSFYISTQIIYGKDSLQQLGEVACKLKVDKAQVILTDPGVAGSGVLDEGSGFSLIKLRSASSFSISVEVNPTVGTVDKAAGENKAAGCNGVIALGVGSPLDAGKGVGVLATNPGGAADYLGVDKVKQPSAPVIAIPTTAGTAAEITDVTVLSDPVKKAKLGLRSAYVAPRVALLDPLLTLGLPAVPTRRIPVWMHSPTPSNRSLALMPGLPAMPSVLKAIELIGRYLRRAVYTGKDVEGRGWHAYCQLISWDGIP